MSLPFSRRAFLKLSAALGAAFFLKPLDALPAEAAGASVSIRGARLVPAYTAVDLICRGALRRIGGPPGRAHDPDGAFTIPGAFAVAALAGQGANPKLDDLWQAEALWPDNARLALGAALLRRGYSINDTHPGHLAQIERDLVALRPRLLPDPLAALRAGQGAVALTLVPLLADGSFVPGHAAKAQFALPLEGVIFIEYDWVAPRYAAQAEAAQFIKPVSVPSIDLAGARCMPPMPLPAAARAQRAEIWARLRNS